ncbi:MAG: recombinase family protein [Acetobacteraceae bacterium]|nr:recombinase family protein [Acetobacteraceae bacterium]
MYAAPRPRGPAGKPVFGVTAQIAEFERGLIRERVNAGPRAAQARGRGFRQVSRQQAPPALSNVRAGRSGRFQGGEHGRGPAEEERPAAVALGGGLGSLRHGLQATPDTPRPRPPRWRGAPP